MAIADSASPCTWLEVTGCTSVCERRGRLVWLGGGSRDWGRRTMRSPSP